VKRVLLALLLLTGCATATHPNDEADVRAAMMNFMSALNDLDAARISASFAEDATAFFPVAQPQRAQGRAEIDAVFLRYFEGQQGKKTNIVPQDMKIETGGDLALVSFQIPGGSTARRTFVFRRTAGRWLITHMHASNFRVQ
jgi:ketosteroid isomerase-like protein